MLQRIVSLFRFVPALVIGLGTYLLLPKVVFAASAGAETGHGVEGAMLFFVIAAILVSAKIFHLIEKIKQPPVVGELVAGIILGNLGLLGIHFFEPFRHDQIISFLAELGVIILLFQIGLESNVTELAKVGMKSTIVALIGAILPFVLGAFIVGPLLLPNQSVHTYLFLGASLAATSVGITARVFKDFGQGKSSAAKIVLGAAVIDDILGLILLAVISSMVSSGGFSLAGMGWITFKSFAFLIGSVLIGQLFAPFLSRAFAMINTGLGTKFTLAISFGLTFAGFAQLLGLEPIIGAFAAGLVLDPVHFAHFKDPDIVASLKKHVMDTKAGVKEKIMDVLHHHVHRNLEETIEPLALFFVPIFFVVTGMSVNIQTLMNPQTFILAVVIAIVAFLGKAVSGVFVPGKDKWIVGLAMVPRGEVGLIFAAIGQQLGVVSDQVFSIIVLTVLITTIAGPAVLARMLGKK